MPVQLLRTIRTGALIGISLAVARLWELNPKNYVAIGTNLALFFLLFGINNGFNRWLTLVLVATSVYFCCLGSDGLASVIMSERLWTDVVSIATGPTGGQGDTKLADGREYRQSSSLGISSMAPKRSGNSLLQMFWRDGFTRSEDNYILSDKDAQASWKRSSWFFR